MSDHTRRTFALVAWFAARAGGQNPKDSIVFRFQVKENADVFSWFPLQLGNRWVYKDSLKSQREKYQSREYMQDSAPGSDLGFPIDDRYPTCRATWLREILVKGHHRIPHGLVVLTQERVTGVRYSF